VKVLQAALVACAIAALLWLSLDSGRFAPRAERFFSMPLIGLGAIFGVSAWAASMSGYPKRAPVFAGLAAGVAGYALLRLVL
jgi:dipeptide/tripeptide permease